MLVRRKAHKYTRTHRHTDKHTDALFLFFMRAETHTCQPQTLQSRQIIVYSGEKISKYTRKHTLTSTHSHTRTLALSCTHTHASTQWCMCACAWQSETNADVPPDTYIYTYSYKKILKHTNMHTHTNNPFLSHTHTQTHMQTHLEKIHGRSTRTRKATHVHTKDMST